MKRALALLVTLAFGALIVVGCQPSPSAIPLRYSPPFTCEPAFNDLPCIACLKQHCCAEFTVCESKSPDKCSCSAKCIGEGNDKACFERCAATEDRAAGSCSVAHCTGLCPGPGPGGTI